MIFFLCVFLRYTCRSASEYLGEHVCDMLDIFQEWREKTGSDDVQLISLALTGREAEVCV